MSKIYSTKAEALSRLYEGLAPHKAYAAWIHLLPESQSKILDVGAGSGRDAAWLASLGHEVVAVEPSRAMRDKAMATHCESNIQWMDDRLPDLIKIRQSCKTFDMLLLNAVWIHVHPKDRQRAMESLVHLLKERGILVITLRHGPSPDERVMHPCTARELCNLAESFGLHVRVCEDMPDLLGRGEISWTHLVFSKKPKHKTDIPDRGEL